jgi:hypothetical protein
MANAPGTYNADGIYVPIDPNADPDATMGTVLRSQWDDYVKTYQPIANAIMGQTTYNDPGIATRAVSAGTADVNSAFDSSAIQQQRQFSRYGMAPSPDQQAALSRDNSINRSSAIVDAANSIRTNLADRNRQIAVGGIPNITSQAAITSVGTSTGTATGG